MSSLLWKEWHEQRWKLAFGCIILAAFALIGLRARIITDQMLLTWVCLMGVLLLPVLASTGLVPAERGEGTLESLLSLPVAPRRILFAKTLVGMLLCAGPLAAAGVISLMLAGGREMSSGVMVGLYAASIASALSLFLWMMALTIGLPNEARAGLLSLGVLVCWVLIAKGLESGKVGPAAWLPCPFVFELGIYTNRPETHFGWLVVAVLVQTTIGLALFWWAATRVTQPVEAVS